MHSGLFLSLVLFKIFLYYSCAITFTNWSQNRYLENQRLTTNIGVLTTPSAIACGVECANISPCMSYSYHVGNSTCLLYAIPFTTETVGAVSEDGWTSYNSMCGNGSKALDYFYKPNLQMCYHLELNEANVSEAMLICSVVGRMLRIDTIEKQAHMVELLTSCARQSVYIGGSSEHRDDVFLYEDGTPITLFFWSPGNPQGQTSIIMRKNANYKWGNVRGTLPRHFLCEIVL